MGRATIWNWLALALLPGLVAAAPEPVPLYREIKDWAVGCDNTRACTALLAIDDELMTGLHTIVRREAGPKGKLELTLRVGPTYADQVLLDGQPLSAGWQHIQRQYDYDLRLEGDEALALLRQLRNGERLSALTEDGELVASLQGLSAALLVVDAVQARVGHADALVRVGDAPAASVPDAPPVAHLSRYIPAPALDDNHRQEMGDAVLRWATEQGVMEDSRYNNLELHPLDEAHALGILSTGCSGEFCANYLYRVSRTAPYQVSELSVEVPVSLLAPNLSGFMAFDSLTGQLYATDKSLLERGCGLVQHWRYDGALMRPERVARMDRCGYVKPEFWPVLWRAEG